MTRPEDVHESLGQAMVYWLWAFLLFMVGVDADIKAMTQSETLIIALLRVMLTGVAGGALMICSLELWWKVRSILRDLTNG